MNGGNNIGNGNGDAATVVATCERRTGKLKSSAMMMVAYAITNNTKNTEFVIFTNDRNKCNIYLRSCKECADNMKLNVIDYDINSKLVIKHKTGFTSTIKKSDDMII